MEGVAVLEAALRGVAVGVKGDTGVLEVGRCPVLCTELETIKPGIAAGVGGFLRGNHCMCQGLGHSHRRRSYVVKQ